ncbi:MAG: hypothetical protein LCI03_10930 [Actinobacteria bacterium]|jgi:hypothetical protein|nr:hypothetical protein [Actinomycetota bacterium]
MTTVVLPSPKDVRDMFEGLLGRGVEVGPGEPVLVSQTTWAAVGAYVEDNLSLSAVVAADVPLAAYAGAALGLLPLGGAQDSIGLGTVDGAMWENFAELLQIGVSLLNHDGAPHVRLYETFPPGELPDVDVLELMRGMGRRVDLHVAIAGYGGGSLSIVRRI